MADASLGAEGQAALDEIDGSLLIAFVFDRERATFVLTCEAPFVPGRKLHGREFWEFRFREVDAFVRVPGVHPVVGGAFRDEFRIGVAQGAWTVWEAHAETVAGGKATSVEISMGVAFGGLRFTSEGIEFESATLVPSGGSDGGKSVYMNAAGITVDFADPFMRRST